MPVKDLSRVLDEAGVRHELLSHARTESAIAEAEALGPVECANSVGAWIVAI
jgi:hypothetical protein